MELEKVTKGSHRGQTFTYQNGFLYMFGQKWDKEDIQILVETANLLSVEGFQLKTPVGEKQIRKRDAFGVYNSTEKLYENMED